MSSLLTKVVIGVFIIIAIYYLLVYYKGGQAYIGNGSKAFNSGVSNLMGAGVGSKARGYATGG